MPLPPLPENNTDRAWLKYTSVGLEHELVIRFPSATTQATIITQMTALANALKPYMKTTDSFIGLRHQDSGSNLSFPLAFTSIAGTAVLTVDGDAEAKYFDVVGRSLGGYRCRVTFFSSVLPDSEGYRVGRVSGNSCDTLLDALEAMVPLPVAVDGGQVIWNQYANIGYNAHWQKKARS